KGKSSERAPAIQPRTKLGVPGGVEVVPQPLGARTQGPGASRDLRARSLEASDRGLASRERHGAGKKARAIEIDDHGVGLAREDVAEVEVRVDDPAIVHGAHGGESRRQSPLVDRPAPHAGRKVLVTFELADREESPRQLPGAPSDE